MSVYACAYSEYHLIVSVFVCGYRVSCKCECVCRVSAYAGQVGCSTGQYYNHFDFAFIKLCELPSAVLSGHYI